MRTDNPAGRPTAQIIPFPVRPRDLAGARDLRAPAAPAVEWDSWYHSEAVREERKPIRH